MELWIRSQDKEVLTRVVDIWKDADKNEIWSKSSFAIKNCLGIYKTKERVMEVLDEIQNKIVQNMALLSLMNNFTDLKGNEKGVSELFKDLIYEMPKE